MPQLNRPLWLLAAILASGAMACAPPPPATPFTPDPDVLGYGLPTGSPAMYVMADTATFTVDSGAMGTMTVGVAYAASVELTMGAGPDALEANLRFQRLDGFFEPQGQTRQRVDETDIRGDFLLSLDTHGRTDMVATPVLSARLLDVTSAEALARPLFVQLPGRAVRAGDAWVDTIASVEERTDSRSSVRTVITTTLVGDTVVDGRTLLLMHTRAENRLELDGRSGGVAVRQLLTGTTDGTVLWDPHYRLLVQRTEDGSLSGVLGLPGAGVEDVPLTARVRRHVRLEGVGAEDLTPGDGDP